MIMNAIHRTLNRENGDAQRENVSGWLALSDQIISLNFYEKHPKSSYFHRLVGA
jgi:hypothetical protein